MVRQIETTSALRFAGGGRNIRRSSQRQAFSAAIIVIATANLAFAAPGYFSRPGDNRAIEKIAIFGADDRVPLPAALAPLAEKIGTLASRRTGAACTAFCISDDAIATAGHCLFGTAVHPQSQAADLEFTVGAGTPKRTSPLAGGETAAQDRNLVVGTKRLVLTAPINAADDWAIARLAHPICTAGGLPLSPSSPAESDAAATAGDIYEIAFHVDRAESGLMLARPCAVLRQFPAPTEKTIRRDVRDPDAILFHTCDTGGGSSGSPLLRDTPHGPQVVAINVGTYVLSRMVTGSAGNETVRGEAVANTAVRSARFANAARAFSAGNVMRSREQADGRAHPAGR